MPIMSGPVAETVDGFQADIEQRAFVLPHSLTRSRLVGLAAV